MLSSTLKDYTTVITKVQKKGRGQMGAKWQSEEGKNLTFSVLKYLDDVQVNQQFHLNIQVSLAIHMILTDLNIPNVRIKWPNDIMSGSKKICGILIENVLNGSLIKKSIIGIGLNVNQVSFGNLTKASSLSLLTGRSFDLDDLLLQILEKMRSFLDREQYSMDGFQAQYEALLFRKDRVSTFKRTSGELFSGIIRGVSKRGKLIVEQEDDTLHEFSLKEISLQY